MAQIGLVGLGTMGRALAEALARAGLDVQAVDPLDAAPAPLGGVILQRDLAAMADPTAPYPDDGDRRRPGR